MRPTSRGHGRPAQRQRQHRHDVRRHRRGAHQRRPRAYYAQSLAIQADGKIDVAGVASVSQGGTTVNALCLLRYNPNGTLDSTSFGTGGKTLNTSVGWLDFGVGSTSLVQMALDSSGRIDITGTARYQWRDRPGDRGPLPARRDSGYDFGSGSMVVSAGGCDGHVGQGRRTPIYRQDRGLRPGQLPRVHGAEPAAVRLNTDGSLDTTFGVGGSNT